MLDGATPAAPLRARSARLCDQHPLYPGWRGYLDWPGAVPELAVPELAVPELAGPELVFTEAGGFHVYFVDTTTHATRSASFDEY